MPTESNRLTSRSAAVCAKGSSLALGAFTSLAAPSLYTSALCTTTTITLATPLQAALVPPVLECQSI